MDTDAQVRKLMKLIGSGKTLGIAAAKVGPSLTVGSRWAFF
jgi:hypothetical protein